MGCKCSCIEWGTKLNLYSNLMCEFVSDEENADLQSEKTKERVARGKTETSTDVDEEEATDQVSVVKKKIKTEPEELMVRTNKKI
jgi:hypothetical protein